MACDSCGADDPSLFEVRRMYITPGDWDTEARELVIDGIEHWCFSCCSMYPHRPAHEDI